MHKDPDFVFPPNSFILSHTSRESMMSLMTEKGPSDLDRPVVIGTYQNRRKGFSLGANFEEIDRTNNVGSGNRLHVSNESRIPPQRAGDEFAQRRQSLPIWKYQEDILNSISSHRVTVILGKSGYGKTTQVPQFILDSASASNTPTRILSCQPHRLSAIMMSGSVARERGERVGVSVGYQARLESCYSPCASVLLFSTNELFLRSLMPPSFPVLQNITHVILDEIHVRDSRTDFALMCLVNLMNNFEFKLILMGGEIDAEGLLAFLKESGADDFGLIHVQQHMTFFPKIFYLDDINKFLGKQGNLESCIYQTETKSNFSCVLDTSETCDCCKLNRSGHLANQLLRRFLLQDDYDAFNEFVDFVLRHEVDVNGTHKDTGLTFLMACTLKGMVSHMRRLIAIGAEIMFKGINGLTALDIAKETRQPAAFTYLYLQLTTSSTTETTAITHDVKLVDLYFILELIHYIHSTSPPDEAILVFLSSYDEIVTLKEMIFRGKEYHFDSQSIVISIFHVNIPCGDERAIFEDAARELRKIVLTTDVADTVQLKNFSHVIDLGYAEERIYNPKNTATGNRKVRISKSAAEDRVRLNTYRIYERKTFENLSLYRKPEIGQCPLQEICLFATSLMNGVDVSVEFFSDFLSPPPTISLTRSLEELVSIGALDKARMMTPLGCYLLDFPVEPRLGKALIYAVMLRCLDPILTIVACLTHRDPFITPVRPEDKIRLRRRKLQLSRNTYSDHMTLLQAFQEWENEADSCDIGTLCKNYISPGTFDMICAIRTDLLGQLRALGFVRCKGFGNIKDLNCNSHNWSVVKAAMIGALYPNVMKINQSSFSLSNNEFKLARFHPLSCIGKDPFEYPILPSPWVVYDEVNQNGVIDFCKGCTLVSPFALAVFGGSPTYEYKFEHHGTMEVTAQNGQAYVEDVLSFKLNEWIEFRGPRIDIELVNLVREKFQRLIQKQLRKPGTMLTQTEEKDLQTITLILTTEDRASDLAQIDGIGQWPRFAGGSLLSSPCQGFKMATTCDSNGTEE